MTLNRHFFAFVFISLLSAGCTGLSFGEKTAGSDTYLEGGAIAVDDRTETSFVLHRATKTTDAEAGPTTTSIEAIFAVSPDGSQIDKVQDMAERNDVRILFPESGIMLMSELNGKDRLQLFDNKTFAEKSSSDLSIRYHGTRMSPSRKWIAVADNTSEKAPIHIINGATLETTVVPHQGEWLEAMWMHQNDELLAIVFYEQNSMNPSARILSWSMDSVASGGFKPDLMTGYWAAPKLDITLPATAADFLFSFTWVGISPDDKYAVFPVRKPDGQGNFSYQLIVVETATGTMNTIDNAKGPVGFTPDGLTIVSYRDVETPNGFNQELLLIDMATLTPDPVTVPLEGGITYFVSHAGNYIVVASSSANQRLVLHDVDQNKTTQMDGPGIGLNEFVSRTAQNELWLVDSQALFRLDMVQATFESVPTSFIPAHINLLPKKDELVLGGDGDAKLYFFSPSTKEITATAALPMP